MKWNSEATEGSDAGSEGKGRYQAGAVNSNPRRDQIRKTLRPYRRMEIINYLHHNPRLARLPSIPSGRILEATTKRGTIGTRRLPLPPNVERTGVSSGDSVARQRAPVGDPLNDEQRCDHLSDPSSH